MYRRTTRCKRELEQEDGERKVCGREVGYELVSHDSGDVLVTARLTCRCGEPGENEEALKWNRQPAASTYQGPTIYQMALGALRR